MCIKSFREQILVSPSFKHAPKTSILIDLPSSFGIDQYMVEVSTKLINSTKLSTILELTLTHSPNIQIFREIHNIFTKNIKFEVNIEKLDSLRFVLNKRRMEDCLIEQISLHKLEYEQRARITHTLIISSNYVTLL